MYLVLWVDLSGLEHWEKCENKTALCDLIKKYDLLREREHVEIYEVDKRNRIPLFSGKESEAAKAILAMLYATPNTKVRWESAGLSYAPVMRLSLTITGRDEDRCVLRPDVFPSLSSTERAVTLNEIMRGGVVPDTNDESDV